MLKAERTNNDDSNCAERYIPLSSPPRFSRPFSSPSFTPRQSDPEGMCRRHPRHKTVKVFMNPTRRNMTVMGPPCAILRRSSRRVLWVFLIARSLKLLLTMSRARKRDGVVKSFLFIVGGTFCISRFLPYSFTFSQ